MEGYHTDYGPGGEREGVLEVLSDDLIQLHDVQQHFAREPVSIGCKDFRTGNGSRQGQSLALTGLFVPSSLDSDSSDLVQLHDGQQHITRQICTREKEGCNKGAV